MSAQKPISFAGEHFDVAEIDPALLLQRKGSKKYLGFIPELCIVCGACVDQCPWHCLFMVDPQRGSGRGLAVARRRRDQGRGTARHLLGGRHRVHAV